MKKGCCFVRFLLIFVFSYTTCGRSSGKNIIITICYCASAEKWLWGLIITRWMIILWNIFLIFSLFFRIDKRPLCYVHRVHTLQQCKHLLFSELTMKSKHWNAFGSIHFYGSHFVLYLFRRHYLENISLCGECALFKYDQKM